MGANAFGARRCPRAHCDGTVLMMGNVECCLLCGREPATGSRRRHYKRDMETTELERLLRDPGAPYHSIKVAH